MAARIDAAAECSLKTKLYSLLFLLFLISSLEFKMGTSELIRFTRESLIYIGTTQKQSVSVTLQYKYEIPVEIIRSPGSPWIIIPSRGRRRRRKERKQKRGCRAGVLAQLKRNPHRPPLPSLLVSNVRSINNKMDELRLCLSSRSTIQKSCVMIFTETWLHRGVPNAAIELAGLSLHRSDRTEDSGKSRGGGLCVYTNNNWCTNTAIIDSHCSPDLELLAVKCRPFYLPREMSVVVVIAVYIPPDAKANAALGYMLNAINKQQNTYPDGVFIVAGDFNHVNLKTVLPKFEQHVKCSTRGKNILDCVYSNIPKAFRTSSLPNFGQSDHLSLFLTPAYCPIIKKQKTVIKTVKTWSEEASLQLQDCFQSTDWSLFSTQNLDEYTSTVLFYIKCCVESVTINKRIRVYPNRKPWMTKEVQLLLRDRDVAFKSGNKELYSASRHNLKRGIKCAKAVYKEKIEEHFTSKDMTRMWQGMHHITNSKGSREPQTAYSTMLAEELNCFFARFERGTGNAALPHLNIADSTLTLQTHEVMQVLKTVNVKKAVGPDGIPGWVLRDCAYQLVENKTEFTCPVFDVSKKGICGTKFSYQDLCQRVPLTPSLKEFFEEGLGKIAASKYCDFKTCPGCESYVERADQKNLCVRCTVCTAKMGCSYEFCWNCRKKWTGTMQNSVHCGNSDCRKPEPSQTKKDLLKLCQPAFKEQKLQTQEIYSSKGKSSDRKRLAMIINNIEFRVKQYKRDGAEKDEESMRTLLEALGYDVIILNDLSAEGMEAAFRDFSQRDEHRYSDSTFCVMMSHGGPDGIHGINIDGNELDAFPVDKIFYYLGPENCPGLIDKPKIILIQACRGDQEGHVWVCDSIRTTKGKIQHREKDFGRFRSCTPDTVSFRNPGSGSAFIQSLVSIFNENAHEDDIVELFRKVAHRFEKATKEDNFPYQMPSLDRTTLVKKFYLFPGL